MFIKDIIAQLAHKLTGRQCSSCTHNRCGRCCHPSGSMFMKCWHSITRPGYKYSQSVQYFTTVLPAINDALQAGINLGMTEEENYQLQKIKAALEEAENAARESGLLEED